MIYPDFIRKGETIGIFAPSAGVGKKLEDFDRGLEEVRKLGYQVKETASVRVNNERSASGKKRAAELKELVEDDEVKMIVCAAGGDFMYEMMPYVDFKSLQAHPKWIMGHSDPTNLLFPLTVKYDIATIYGFNAGYDEAQAKFQKDNMRIISGDLVKQKSFRKYKTFLEMKQDEKKYTHEVRWISKGDQLLKGRIIGGCLDAIVPLFATPFDGIKDFLGRYKDDGILWYFDIFALDPLTVYLTLLQMKNAGYFRYCRGVLFGRIAFPGEGNITYLEAYRKALGKIPWIAETDIGHTDPHFTIVNGALAEVRYSDGKGSISFFLK